MEKRNSFQLNSLLKSSTAIVRDYCFNHCWTLSLAEKTKKFGIIHHWNQHAVVAWELTNLWYENFNSIIFVEILT